MPPLWRSSRQFAFRAICSLGAPSGMLPTRISPRVTSPARAMAVPTSMLTGHLLARRLPRRRALGYPQNPYGIRRNPMRLRRPAVPAGQARPAGVDRRVGATGRSPLLAAGVEHGDRVVDDPVVEERVLVEGGRVGLGA